MQITVSTTHRLRNTGIE